MNVVITGHRKHKLEAYDTVWIKREIENALMDLTVGQSLFVRGYSGMAGGVDLWFCDACYELGIKWVACVPFEEQELTMQDEDEREHRETLLNEAEKVLPIRNSAMVEFGELFIVVWDGNKGGTHNVVQQIIEKKKNFIWINPVSKVIWKCFV